MEVASAPLLGAALSVVVTSTTLLSRYYLA